MAIMPSFDGLSSKLHLKHKLLLIICLTLSVYTLITSQTMSALITMGFSGHHLLFRNDRQLIETNYDRKRGVRTTDRFGRLLYYHLPNLTDYHIIYFYRPIGTTLTTHTTHEHQYCHQMGTDWNQTTASDDRCVCADDYSGADCGIPSLVSESLEALHALNSTSSPTPPHLKLKRLTKPKRLVLSVILYTNSGHQSIPSLRQYLNDTIKDLSHFVDLFIITRINIINTKSKIKINKCDPNVGHSCQPSGDDIWDQLKANSYSDIVLYSTINVTAKQLRTIGTNGLHLYAISKVWKTSIKRVTDFRPNDVLIYMSVNTFPLQKIVMFLKHYTGFPEPIKLITYSSPNSPSNASNEYDLLAKQLMDPLVANNNSLVNIAVTFEYLSLLCRYDFSLFKTNLCVDNEVNVKKFNETYWPIKYWTVGSFAANCSANVLLPDV